MIRGETHIEHSDVDQDARGLLHDSAVFVTNGGGHGSLSASEVLELNIGEYALVLSDKVTLTGSGDSLGSRAGISLILPDLAPPSIGLPHGIEQDREVMGNELVSYSDDGVFRFVADKLGTDNTQAELVLTHLSRLLISEVERADEPGFFAKKWTELLERQRGILAQRERNHSGDAFTAVSELSRVNANIAVEIAQDIGSKLDAGIIALQLARYRYGIIPNKPRETNNSSVETHASRSNYFRDPSGDQFALSGMVQTVEDS